MKKIQLNDYNMNIEIYFEQEKDITVDAARNAGAKYNAIDLCRFAKKYHDEETKFILVSDELPPEHENVLVQFGDQNILIGVMDSNNQWAIFWSDGIKADDHDRPIDYWMPLPA